MSGNSMEISKLATILHENGDKVLNALSKLSLNAVVLQRLNKEFENLLGNSSEGETMFQVISSSYGNSQLFKDLHFLHDFIQKTVGLKLSNNSSLSLLNNKVDISKFKNIKYLEIKKIPIKEVTGLKNVQSQLESIVCIRCLSKLEELLACCGGDNSNGFVWHELREAVICFNDIKVVDTSVAFAPWLQVLDLSHNQISDVKAIECLPNLKYVNLSFNYLEVIPTFNKSARKKIEILVMMNNYIEDMSGISGLHNLTELDLTNNLIASCDGFNHFLSISTLASLNLKGNPISYHQNYRRTVAGFLHISASFSDFFLDNIKLSKKEKAVVGIKLCDGGIVSNKTNAEGISKDSIKSKFPVNDISQPVSNSRKSGKGRVVVIPNLDDGTYEEPFCDFNNLEFMTSSTEHLITKKRIENTRNAYGVDTWLVQGGSVVQEILGLPPLQVSTSTPYDDLCLQAALDAFKNVVTTTAVIETQPEDQTHISDKSNSDAFISCTEENPESQYFSVETYVENEIEKVEKPVPTAAPSLPPSPSSKEVSPDIEEIQESEELELDENEKLYVVSREVKTYNNEIKQEEMFLVITETELQEREPTKGKIVTKWSLSSLESCVKLKANQLQFVFDTVRRDKRERTYVVEEQEAKTLYKQIAEILESRTLSDMNQVVYKCEKCSSQFSKEVNSRKAESNLWCPFCYSNFVLQLDEVPLPSSDKNPEEKKVNGVKNPKNSETKVSHNRSSSAGGFFQSLLSQNQTEEKILKCPSQSSIDLTSQSTEGIKSSAASLDELNGLPTVQSMNVKRSDSDIEILSNPSQSSIEVLDGPGRKKSSEERQIVTPAADLAANNNILLLNNNPPGLTESSSSGSITDSICTAYESNSAVPSNVNKSEIVKTLPKEIEGELEKSKLIDQNFEPILQDVLEKAKTDIEKHNAPDLVTYSYSDFINIDHRIKLFLYTQVFDDDTEEFNFGLRATILPYNSDSYFPSCVIASNKKLYFLKVTNTEIGDDARNFLQKIDSLSFSLSSVKCIYTLTWYQGFGINIQLAYNKSKQYLILLKDTSRTKNFLKFLLTTDIPGLVNTKIIEETLEKPYLAMQHLLLSNLSLKDSSIQHFCLFNSCSISDSLGRKELNCGSILVNLTELLIFSDNSNWLFDGAEKPSNPVYFEKFINLMKVYKKQSKLFLQFFDGVVETQVWSLVFESNESAEELLLSTKLSWEKLFSVPLETHTL